MVDPLAAMMLVVVTTVALLVQIYSRGLWEAEVEHGDHGDTHVMATSPTRLPIPIRTARTPTTTGPTSGPSPLVRDPAYGRFFAYLGLFTGAMLVVLSNNLLVMYMFWRAWASGRTC